MLAILRHWSRGQIRQIRVVGVVLFALVMPAASVAASSTPLPTSSSAVNQYMDALPTGTNSTSGNGSGGARQRIPPAASSTLPTSSSAVDQYVEAVPTGTGGMPAYGSGGAGRQISPALRAQIERTAGPDAGLLERVLGSYGAPTTQSGQASAQPSGGSSSLSVAVTAVASGSEGRVLGLVAAMLVITVALIGSTLLRHRREETRRA